MHKVTVIGLGAMGAAIAAVLVEQNYQVTVWNRTPQGQKPLSVKEPFSLPIQLWP